MKQLSEVQQMHSQQLRKEGLALLTFDEVLGGNFLGRSEWQDFIHTWNDLPTDRYMKDGGTYRERRFSRFHLDIQSNKLRQKEHAPYSQPEYLNPLNGGILRHFDPIKSSTVSIGIFRDFLVNMGNFLGKADNKIEWDINVYQNRTRASSDTKGKPVPEGMHRDGVSFSVLLGIGRENVNGAVSTIFDDDKEPLHTCTIVEGDVLVFNDEITYHDTTEVELSDSDINNGTRDVMVIEFYTSLVNKNQYYVK